MTDALSSQAALAGWARARDLEPGAFAETVAVRDALRQLVAGEKPTLPKVSLEPSCDGAGLSLTSATVAEAALSAAVRLSILGTMPRVKLCQAETCREAYFDRSRNGSRAWCSMEVCGNRQKARSYRNKSHPDVES